MTRPGARRDNYSFRGETFLEDVEKISSDLDLIASLARDRRCPDRFIERVLRQKLAIKRRRRTT